MSVEIKYRLKIVITLLIINGVAFGLAKFVHTGWGIAAFVAGVVFLINRHAKRCLKCGSWFTETWWSYGEDMPAGKVSYVKTKQCKVCRVWEILDSYERDVARNNQIDVDQGGLE